MKAALIGASGNVGSRILAELLSRGHEVTGIVRHPEKLPAREGLTAKRFDVNDEAGLAQLLAGHDAVISSVRFQSVEPPMQMSNGKGELGIRADGGHGG